MTELETQHTRAPFTFVKRAANPGFVAPAAVVLVLMAAYVATLAPTVTYWDSGEFIAAIRTLGIPHPPGTPMYVLIGNVWASILSPVVGYAYAVNLLSAAATATACGVFTWLMAKWTGDSWAASAGGLLAGLMSTVWLNANETEVYAPALLVSALLLLVAEQAASRRDTRYVVLLGYLCGVAWALQLSALVAAPAAIILAAGIFDRNRMWWRTTVTGTLKIASGTLAAAVLGASAVLFMLVRARHDPGINQGNPATWQALVDVISRAQYQPVAVFPRQAPFFIQIGNLIEYADWQVALGLSPDPPPSWVRTPFTMAYAILGAIGVAWHRRAHRSSWRVMSVLFACATLGIIVYLNMKASPSYGHGVLPLDAVREARERDYFFALAFVIWGLWAGAGGMRLFSRAGSAGRMAAMMIAALPLILNAPAVNRAKQPRAYAASDSARRILDPVPAMAVVFAYGDNDTYPAWFAQKVEGIRPDVTLITIPLLGAKWYREELARRDLLLTADLVKHWRGIPRTLEAICNSAAQRGRPVVSARVAFSGATMPAACIIHSVDRDSRNTAGARR